MGQQDADRRCACFAAGGQEASRGVRACGFAGKAGGTPNGGGRAAHCRGHHVVLLDHPTDDNIDCSQKTARQGLPRLPGTKTRSPTDQAAPLIAPLSLSQCGRLDFPGQPRVRPLPKAVAECSVCILLTSHRQPCWQSGGFSRLAASPRTRWSFARPGCRAGGRAERPPLARADAHAKHLTRC